MSEANSTGDSFLPAQNLTASSRRCLSTELGAPTAHASLVLDRLYLFSSNEVNLVVAQPDSVTMIRIDKMVFMFVRSLVGSIRLAGNCRPVV